MSRMHIDEVETNVSLVARLLAAQFPQFPVTRSYQELEAAIVAAAAQT